MLGLSTAATAAVAVGSTALGGVIQKITDEEKNKGTWWTTATFDDGVVHMRDPFVPEGWAQESYRFLEEAHEIARGDFTPPATAWTDRVVTLSVQGNYPSAYGCLSGNIAVFGRTPKIGEVIRFGDDPVYYTIIEVYPDDGRHHSIVLDRPLELGVKDKTAVHKVGTSIHGGRRIERQSAELTIYGVTFSGPLTATWREDRPMIPLQGLDSWGDEHYHKDVSIDIDLSSIAGAEDMGHEVLMNSGCIDEIVLNARESGTYRFRRCYSRQLGHCMTSGTMSYVFTCEEIVYETA